MTVGVKKNLTMPIVSMGILESPDRERNNPNDDNKGVLNLPGEGTDPSSYNRNGVNAGKKMCFPKRVANGESPNIGDVYCHTANGVSSSRGQGHNQEYNWSDGTDGRWSGNRNWPGGNRTGE